MAAPAAAGQRQGKKANPDFLDKINPMLWLHAVREPCTTRKPDICFVAMGVDEVYVLCEHHTITSDHQRPLRSYDRMMFTQCIYFSHTHCNKADIRLTNRTWLSYGMQPKHMTDLVTECWICLLALSLSGGSCCCHLVHNYDHTPLESLSLLVDALENQRMARCSTLHQD